MRGRARYRVVDLGHIELLEGDDDEQHHRHEHAARERNLV